VIRPRVIRETEKLPDPVRREAQDLILELASDPYPPDSLRLRNSRNSRRIRFYWGRHPRRKNPVALYRLVYQVFDATRTIKILRIAYRDELTYSGFDRW
jgi:mRNA-degrading endonuclease RelE of RelBE toxin-antitoxin system